MNDSPNDADQRIAPVAYKPPGELRPARGGGRRLGPWLWLTPLVLVAAAIGWFLLTAKAVHLDVVPPPDRLAVDGGIGVSFGGHKLLRPGQYTVRAGKDGYRDLQEAFTVGDTAEQTFRWQLARLPGKLTVQSKPDAEVIIDGSARGQTPLADIELAPGSHRVLVRAPRFQVFETTVEIEGGGVAQNLAAELVPGWASVSVSSVPSAADLLVDGVPSGKKTPAALEVGAGSHEIAVQLAGYKTDRQTVEVKANEPITLAEVRLAKADGKLHVRSTPGGAAVAIDGAYKGVTPLSIALYPGDPHRIDVSAPGYESAQRTVKLDPDAGADLDVALTPILGTVIVSLDPPDAVLLVDGKAQADGAKTLQLTAIPHRIEARKDGFGTFSTKVTPRADFPQNLDIKLVTETAARAARTPGRLASAGGPQFVLVQPGAFRMGTERGSQGRQSNEAQRPVRLTRPFYLSTKEITNAQFKQFEAGHSSGIVARESLDNDGQPVVRVSWESAAKYCNWLSAKDGLPAAYKDENGTMVLTGPAATGYRLPTEAEWEWAARFAGNPAGLRYPWGASLPPPAGAGNYADAKAAKVAAQVIAGYDDGYVAASPVGSFAPNGLGIFDLGGNVAEWVHDLYDASLAINPPEVADPLGATSGADHVIRGSSWMHGRIIELRLAFRDFGREPRMDVGFRVARYAE